MGRKKNPEGIVQIIILTGFMIILIAGMLSGKVNYYIHPRYNIGIWFSIIILFFFIISLSADLKKARHNVHLNSYIIFVVPILTAVMFPAAELGKTEMSVAKVAVSADSVPGNTGSYKYNAKATDFADSRADNTASAETEDAIIDYTNNPDNVLTSSYDTKDPSAQTPDQVNSIEDNEIQTYDDMSEKYKGAVVDGATVIDDDYFASWYYDTYDHLKDFVGKRYQYLAQVYPSDDFGKNRFLAGRYIMVCCAADAAGYGIICENDISGDLKENEWITVTGTIAEYDYQGTKIPMLTDTVITKAKAPKEEYVYYNFY
jgi:putative membrane protein